MVLSIAQDRSSSSVVEACPGCRELERLWPRGHAHAALEMIGQGTVGTPQGLKSTKVYECRLCESLWVHTEIKGVSSVWKPRHGADPERLARAGAPV